MTFLTDLATNGTEKGVGFVFFSGNDDSLIAHRGTEGAYYFALILLISMRVPESVYSLWS